MFSKMKNQTKQPSIISKVTLWYTVFVSLLFIVMFVSRVARNDSYYTRCNRNVNTYF